MLMRSVSSNAIFHTCDDNLKMRQTPPAETKHISVIARSNVQSPQLICLLSATSASTPAATQENDRTQTVTEYRA